MGAEYILRGNRPGFDFTGLTRIDDPDGYTRFLNKDGTVGAVVLTALLRG